MYPLCIFDTSRFRPLSADTSQETNLFPRQITDRLSVPIAGLTETRASHSQATDTGRIHPDATCRPNLTRPAETNPAQFHCHPRGARRHPRVASGSARGGGLPSFSTGSVNSEEQKIG
jgi:hypothetical protein